MFGNASESVSVTNVGLKGRRKEYVGFAQKDDEVRCVGVGYFSGLVVAIVLVVCK